MVSLLSARGRCKTAAKIGARPALGQPTLRRKQSTLSRVQETKRLLVRYWRAANGAGRVFMRTSVQSRAMAAMAGAGLGVAVVSFCILSGWLLLELY
jgi:DNA-binding transcriptional LysR family regulator